jgi:hypothetical protein
MTITANYQGKIELPVHVALTNTATTIVGTAMDSKSFILSGFVFANNNAASKVCQLFWYDFSTTTERLVFTKTIATADTWVESNMPLRLRKSDEIRVKADTGVNVTLLYMTSLPL